MAAWYFLYLASFLKAKEVIKIMLHDQLSLLQVSAIVAVPLLASLANKKRKGIHAVK